MPKMTSYNRTFLAVEMHEIIMFQNAAGSQNFPRKFENKNKQNNLLPGDLCAAADQVSKLKPGMGLSGVGGPHWA